MKEIRTKIEIDATPEQVWEVLTDFESYPDWNPLITSVSGDAAPGLRVSMRLEPPGRPAMTIKPTVLRSEPGREFRWLGRAGLPRIFDGEHVFELSPTADGGTTLLHREEFRGVLVWPFLAWIGGSTETGFGAMNEALKARVEARAGGVPVDQPEVAAAT